MGLATSFCDWRGFWYNPTIPYRSRPGELSWKQENGRLGVGFCVWFYTLSVLFVLGRRCFWNREGLEQDLGLYCDIFGGFEAGFGGCKVAKI